MIVALNKANLSVTSLNRRINQKALDDGVFAGALAGAPD
jgi:hypothetical protein